MRVLALAAVLLPGILGCCMPDKLKGKLGISSYVNLADFILDFTKNKLIVSPVDPNIDMLEMLIDFNTDVAYLRYKNGDCFSGPYQFPGAYQQCIPQNATDLKASWGMVLPGMGLFEYDISGSNVKLLVIDDNCLPFSLDMTGPNGHFWSLSNTEVRAYGGNTDSLDQDNSDCIAVSTLYRMGL